MLTLPPPSAKPENAPLDEFSAGRAFADVKKLTEHGPRVTPLFTNDDSESSKALAHEKAAEYLLTRLKELGLTPRMQKDEVCDVNHEGQQECFVGLKNIFAKIEGASSQPMLMLSAHYDSVDEGPGAGDDAAGVAAVLEIARVMIRKGPLVHPILLLFTDNEEGTFLGSLMGAKYFVRHNPLAHEVGLVLNFDNRGTKGPAVMYEVSQKGAELISLYSQKAEHPRSNSVIATLYHLLPNRTDLTVFQRAGMQGLNFAFADGERYYHTAQDDINHLDPRSLQHMGDQGLSMAEAFANEPTFPNPTYQAVWFDVFGKIVIHYRAKAAQVFAVLGALLAIAALIVAWRRKLCSSSFVISSLLQTLLGIVALFSTMFILEFGISWLVGKPHLWWQFLTYPHWILAFAMFGCLGYGLFSYKFSSHHSSESDLVNTVFLWTIASLGSSWFSPGASYLFTWPALGASAGLLWLSHNNLSSWQKWLALSLPLWMGSFFWITLVPILLIMGGYQIYSITLIPLVVLYTLSQPWQRLLPKSICWILRSLLAVIFAMTLRITIWP